MFVTHPAFDHVTLLPSGFDLTTPGQPRVRRYAAELLDAETGDTCIVANILTLAGAGEAQLATELAGLFNGQVLQVWPMDQPRPSTVQTRTYWVQLERPEVDPEVGPIMSYFTWEVTIPAGFILGEGGEIARLHVLVARTMPGWSVVNMAPADQDAEEF